jgi:hypothetical protein
MEKESAASALSFFCSASPAEMVTGNVFQPSYSPD